MSKSILIFRTGQLGDTLMAMPAIQTIRRKYPKDHLILLTDRRRENTNNVTAWDVLEPTGWFDDVLLYHPADGLLKKALTFWNLRKEIKKVSPKVFYDLSSYRTERQHKRDRFYFRWIVGIPEYKGYQIFQKPKKSKKGQLPAFEPEWKRLLKLVGVYEAEMKFDLPIPVDAQKKAEQLIKEAGLTEKKFIALGPGSKMLAKRWLEERYSELIERLIDKDKQIEIIILGANEDKELGQRLSGNRISRIHNLAGSLSIYESAAMLKKCSAYIGNDTGTMHLAAMVGTPCVAIFSARDYPGWWEPYGNDHIVLRKDTDCAGCMLEVCDKYDNKCLKLITIDEVFWAVSEVLRLNNTMRYH